MLTHQVHDEVQLDGEVDDEEDTGPGVPGVGGHHHVWETRCAEHYHRAPQLSPLLHPPRGQLSVLPSLLSVHGLRAHRDTPIPGHCLRSGVEHSWLKREDPGAPAEGPGPSRAHTHLAVVRRTNRLTMLFSSVLKYCRERRQKNALAPETDRHGPPGMPWPVLPSHPSNSASSQGILRRTEEGANSESSCLCLPELCASGRSRQLTGAMILETCLKGRKGDSLGA